MVIHTGIRWLRGLMAKCLISRRLHAGNRFLLGGACEFNIFNKGHMSCGNHVLIMDHTYIGCSGTLEIGSQCFINRGCIIACMDSISIGNHVRIAPSVHFYDHNHKFDATGIKEGFACKPISVGNHCWIGASCIILPGASIGDNVIIGAGCIIEGTIPSNSLVTGNRQLSIQPLEERR